MIGLFSNYSLLPYHYSYFAFHADRCKIIAENIEYDRLFGYFFSSKGYASVHESPFCIHLLIVGYSVSFNIKIHKAVNILQNQMNNIRVMWLMNMILYIA